MITKGKLRIYKYKRKKKPYEWYSVYVILPSDRDTVKKLLQYDKREVVVVLDKDISKLEKENAELRRLVELFDKVLGLVPTAVLEKIVATRKNEMNELLGLLKKYRR